MLTRIPVAVLLFARIFDVSCPYSTPEFSAIQYNAFNDWDACPGFNLLEAGLMQEMKDYYGITVGEYANAVVLSQKVKVPLCPMVDWVELNKLSGGLDN